MFEILKAKYFLVFSKQFKKIGVVLDQKDEKKNVNDIEKWPLIQSFALDGTYFFIFVSLLFKILTIKYFAISKII